MMINDRNYKSVIPSRVEGYKFQLNCKIGKQQDCFISILKCQLKNLLSLDSPRNDGKRLRWSINQLKMTSDWPLFHSHQTFDMRITPVYIARL